MTLLYSFSKSLLKFPENLNQKPIVRLIHLRLGVWDVFVRKPVNCLTTILPSQDDLENYVLSVGLVWRFIKEIYDIAPRQFWIHVLNNVWGSVEDMVSVYSFDMMFLAVRLLWANYSTLH